MAAPADLASSAAPVCSLCIDGSGWIHNQHPCKPLGVIMNSGPCRVCNADGHKPSPFPQLKITIRTDVDATGLVNGPARAETITVTDIGDKLA